MAESNEEYSSVSAVLVSTPSAQHEHLTCAALLAGKHVLCEKPVALNLAAVERCYDIANKVKNIYY